MSRQSGIARAVAVGMAGSLVIAGAARAAIYVDQSLPDLKPEERAAVAAAARSGSVTGAILGVTVIPDAMNHYTALYPKLVQPLLEDPAFRAAVRG